MTQPTSLDVIVEEKDGRGQEDPDNKNANGTLKFTDAQWSADQIYRKMDNRLALLLGLKADHRLAAYQSANQTFKTPGPIRPYSGPDQEPTIREVRKITKIKFELKGNTQTLQAAVNADIDRLRAKYAQYSYTFDVQFGVN